MKKKAKRSGSKNVTAPKRRSTSRTIKSSREKRKSSKITDKKISFSYLEEHLEVSNKEEKITKKISKSKKEIKNSSNSNSKKSIKSRSISNSKKKLSKRSNSNSKKKLRNSTNSNFSKKENLFNNSSKKIKTKKSKKNSNDTILERILKNAEIFRKNTLNDKKTKLTSKNEQLDYLLYKIAKFGINENEKLINNWFELKIKNISEKKQRRITLGLKEKKGQENFFVEIQEFEIPEINRNDSEYKDFNFFNIREEKEEKMDIKQMRRIRKSVNIIKKRELEKNLDNDQNENIFDKEKKDKKKKNLKNKDKRVSEVFSALDNIKKNNFFSYEIRFFKIKNMVRKARIYDQEQKIENKQKKFMKKIQMKQRKSVFNFPILKNLRNSSSPVFYEKKEKINKKVSESDVNVFKINEEISFTDEESENNSDYQKNNFENQKNNSDYQKNNFGKKNKFSEDKDKEENEENLENENFSDDSFIMVKDVDYLNSRFIIKDYGRFNYTKMLNIGKNLGEKN